MAYKDRGAQFVVYGLSLDGVDHRYVGFTGVTGVRQRLAGHRFDARHDRWTSRHLDWMREVGPENVQIVVLERAEPGTAQEALAALEVQWIARLRAEGFDLLNLSGGGLGAPGTEGPRWPLQRGDPQTILRSGVRAPRKSRAGNYERRKYEMSPESLAEKKRTGALAAHRRWHVGRGIIKPECSWCQEPQD